MATILIILDPDPSDEDLENPKQRARKCETKCKSRAVGALCVCCVKIEVVIHVVTDAAWERVTLVCSLQTRASPDTSKS